MGIRTSSNTVVAAAIWGVPWLRVALRERGIAACPHHDAQVAVIGLEQDADLESVRRAVAEGPDVPTLVLVPRAASADHACRVLHAIELGAMAVLPVDASIDEIAAALVDLVAHRSVIHPFAGALLAQALRARAEQGRRFAITARERDVLGLLTEGHTTANIARALRITFHTANTHVRNIYRKLDVGSKAAATAIALRHQLV